MRPLFIFSLPRSGSTLVQRALGAEEQVATAAEPWVLLPLLYATREHGVRAEYWHQTSAQAVGDFVARLDEGHAGWHAEVRAFATALYERAGGTGRAYFLDKTPRYHSIAAELMQVFPDGRFVFLWRHPLAIVASMLETFRLGRFEPHHWDVDLYAGLAHLIEARSQADERVHSVRYEDLVGGGDTAWRELYAFLELDFDPAVLERLSGERPPGRYGDPTGVERYATIAAEPIDKWTHTFRGPVRRGWAARYVRWIGAERMAAIGYDLDATLTTLRSARGNPLHLPADVWHLASARRAARRRASALALAEGPQPLGPAFDA